MPQNNIEQAVFGLSDETVRRICDVLCDFNCISLVKIYGSRAKGNYRPGSDIDLVLYGDNIDIKTLNTINGRLDDLLLPYSFDLTVWQSINNRDLREHIERVGKMFCRR